MPRSTNRLLAPLVKSNAEGIVARLERWKAISSIASAIAIPFVLAVVGYFIQRQLAEEGLKKDYVAIATAILKENAANQEPELRKWAVLVLDSNSPIPFSGKVKETLEKGVYLRVAPPRMPGPPEPCMKPHRPARIGPLIHKLSKTGVGDVQEVFKQFDQLIEVSVRAEGEAMQDRVALECMQNYGRLVEKWDAETAARYATPIPIAPIGQSPK
jgi:hypothetical protein